MFGLGTLKRIVVARAATKVLEPLRKDSGMKSWQTSLAGIAMILSALSKIVSHDWQVSAEDVAIITGGIGLLRAKDAGVTGVGPDARRP